MANKNLFYDVTDKAAFERELAAGNVSADAIAFLKSTREIWAKGVYYPCDFSAPVLNAAPSSATKTYTDTIGSVRSFAVGQACIYQDWVQHGGYGVAILKGVENGIAIWHDTGVYIRRLEEVELVAEQSYVASQEAVSIADEAREVANAAREAVATLEGLANADTAQQVLAQQVGQIMQNATDIASMKETMASQLLSVEMTEDGEVNVITGEDNAMLHGGYIEDTGDVVLELIY